MSWYCLLKHRSQQHTSADLKWKSLDLGLQIWILTAQSKFYKEIHKTVSQNCLRQQKGHEGILGIKECACQLIIQLIESVNLQAAMVERCDKTLIEFSTSYLTSFFNMKNRYGLVLWFSRRFDEFSYLLTFLKISHCLKYPTSSSNQLRQCSSEDLCQKWCKKIPQMMIFCFYSSPRNYENKNSLSKAYTTIEKKVLCSDAQRLAVHQTIKILKEAPFWTSHDHVKFKWKLKEQICKILKSFCQMK